MSRRATGPEAELTWDPAGTAQTAGSPPLAGPPSLGLVAMVSPRLCLPPPSPSFTVRDLLSEDFKNINASLLDGERGSVPPATRATSAPPDQSICNPRWKDRKDRNTNKAEAEKGGARE
eukprot:GHVU01200238.1.p1 GENE.GHVU01200238.1~~GHVU01200238.1.p1  ORF type:complete len:119 (-),score=15.04 GHVU01200238.1:117-473(-)